MNTISDNRRNGDEWAIYPAKNGGGRYKTEMVLRRDTVTDPDIRIDTTDPRVGRRFHWGGTTYTAVCRAVVYHKDQPDSLLLEDWTGYP